MKETDLALLSIAELARQIKAGKASPVEVTQATLERIQRLDKKLNSYITVMGESALAEARRAEREIARGKHRGPLHGVPVSLKDLYNTKGVRTTAGSKILADFVPNEDCTVAARLRQAGAVIIGKTNMHEFALGVSNENPHFGPVRNPWDLERIPGGSSGGSAAALAACLCAGSLGSDTGGSIRIPASLCGIVGIKPTYGRVSRAGVLPLAWSMDHAGPMTRTVEDAALMLQAIAGWDSKDPASANVPVPDYRRGLKAGVRGLRVGIIKTGAAKGTDSEVAAAFRKAVKVLEGLGANVSEVSIGSLDNARLALRTIVSSEAGSVHEDWLRTRPADYGPDVRARLEVSRLILAADYLRAQRVRNLVRRDFANVLGRVDVLVIPTTPITAVKIGERSLTVGDRVVDLMTGTGGNTSPINLTGLPALSVPCGFSKAGLPIGLQIVGRAFAEGTVLRAGWAYEASTEWHKKRPALG
ncbi:MAG: Asp-tRNA(Asn)/Glu-tRNA(Gln) amidotransferase subunit GatA [Chloroflexi bacterium]|nr:Asp-tRNA(Asn)/Glu-tRNA(Gln) amidotransferase subunit GatA [Chloroflexota bacterium]